MSERHDIGIHRTSWIVGVVVALGVVGATACSSDQAKPGRNIPDNPSQQDAGSSTDTTSPDIAPAPDDTGFADTVDRRDAGEPDTSADGSTGRSLPPVETQQLCAAGGVAKGDQYTLIQCTAPVDLSGKTMEGSGYQLQPGAFRVISE